LFDNVCNILLHLTLISTIRLGGGVVRPRSRHDGRVKTSD
jgi:hypothetical protein